MPAYSFKKQFVQFVIDGNKTHTIRRFRKKAVMPGNTLHLYYGMRTKYCKKLRQEKCYLSESIAIGNTGNVIILGRPFLAEKEIIKLKRLVQQPDTWIYNELWGIPARSLNEQEKEELAWRDGFRPEGTTFETPTGCFASMLQFWSKTHDLPFVGNIIHWDPSKDHPYF
jgi:hypothetical protein